MCLLRSIIILFFISTSGVVVEAQRKPSFRAVAIAENGGHHIAFSKAATLWLNELARQHDFTIDYISSADSIDETFLKRYQLFIQLDYPPYMWSDKAMKAFEKYIDEGKGGWVGLHHATLLGEFDGYPMWKWFSQFMGDIQFKNYIPTFADGAVLMEDRKHPVMKGVPSPLTIQKEEWYTYNKSPRAHVQVIASVNENTYSPASDITMGDHPVVWTNAKKKARNVYIFMGHSPDLFNNTGYATLLRNAVLWAARSK